MVLQGPTRPYLYPLSFFSFFINKKGVYRCGHYSTYLNSEIENEWDLRGYMGWVRWVESNIFNYLANGGLENFQSTANPPIYEFNKLVKV